VVPRRIFEPEGKRLAGGWRRLHNKELHNLCASPNIIRVIGSKWMRWVGNVARMGAVRNTVFWFENLKGRGHSEYLGVDGRIIGLGQTGFGWLRIGSSGGLL
jgi:hypothetical protein